MIITDRFVMINFPKTGSSFARTMLKRVHRPKGVGRILARLGSNKNPGLNELFLPKIVSKANWGTLDQHGTVQQIPQEHRHKPIVSIIRNPLARYVSTYLFRWWERYPPADPEEILPVFPNFPDLTFSEYRQMSQLFGSRDRPGADQLRIEIGTQSIQFILFFFYSPDAVLKSMDDAYIDEKKYLDDMARVRFLHQENLNEELYQYLLEVGYRERDISFVRRAHRINVTKRDGKPDNFEAYYTKELREEVYHQERLLFELFPEYA